MPSPAKQIFTRAVEIGYLPVSHGQTGLARNEDLLTSETGIEGTATNLHTAIGYHLADVLPATMVHELRRMAGVTILRRSAFAWEKLREAIAKKLDGTQAAVEQELSRLNACPLEPIRLVPKRLTREGDIYAAVLAGAINAVGSMECLLGGAMSANDRQTMVEFRDMLAGAMTTIMRRSYLAVCKGIPASVYFSRVADGAWYGRGLREDLTYPEYMALQVNQYPLVSALRQYEIRQGVVDEVQSFQPLFMTGGLTAYVVQAADGEMLPYVSQIDLTRMPVLEVMHRDVVPRDNPVQISVANFGSAQQAVTVKESNAAWIVPTNGQIAIGQDVFMAGGLALAMPQRKKPLVISAASPSAAAFIVELKK